MVDIESVKTFEPLFTLEDLRRQQNLADLLALRRGNRFSVMPVTIEYYQQIIRLRSA
ncbi:MAG TPA: EVE domain-containing protein [bacterium]|nr:EVE domain-containing protein [bacterium]HPG44992.1 EVE domain-containing protein [bacterium]HPM97234.1 EVE domain-containing protein [bacterium]